MYGLCFFYSSFISLFLNQNNAYGYIFLYWWHYCFYPETWHLNNIFMKAATWQLFPETWGFPKIYTIRKIISTQSWNKLHSNKNIFFLANLTKICYSDARVLRLFRSLLRRTSLKNGIWKKKINCRYFSYFYPSFPLKFESWWYCVQQFEVLTVKFETIPILSPVSLSSVRQLICHGLKKTQNKLFCHHGDHQLSYQASLQFQNNMAWSQLKRLFMKVMK